MFGKLSAREASASHCLRATKRCCVYSFQTARPAFQLAALFSSSDEDNFDKLVLARDYLSNAVPITIIGLFI
jgi:hypothetical protein